MGVSVFVFVLVCFIYVLSSFDIILMRKRVLVVCFKQLAFAEDSGLAIVFCLCPSCVRRPSSLNFFGLPRKLHKWFHSAENEGLHSSR